MKNKKRTLRRAGVAVVILGAITFGSSVAHAAPPSVTTDDGAFVRMLGNPSEGTVKFQFGWMSSTVASDAAGYWIGVYDVTNSHYIWNSDTGPIDLPDRMSRNAHPTSELPDGEYKVVFFVREIYSGTVTNLAEIEVSFVVDAESMD